MKKTKKVVDNTKEGTLHNGHIAASKIEVVDASLRSASAENLIVNAPPKGLEDIVDPLPLENIEIREIRVEVPVEKVVIKEVIKYVEKPRLEGYELYARLRDMGYYQGGIGMTMENPNGIDKVYIPEASEIYPSFAIDPDKWNIVRDSLCRVWIELNQDAV